MPLFNDLMELSQRRNETIRKGNSSRTGLQTIILTPYVHDDEVLQLMWSHIQQHLLPMSFAAFRQLWVRHVTRLQFNPKPDGYDVGIWWGADTKVRSIKKLVEKLRAHPVVAEPVTEPVAEPVVEPVAEPVQRKVTDACTQTDPLLVSDEQLAQTGDAVFAQAEYASDEQLNEMLNDAGFWRDLLS
jgi:hypothetical protein